MSSGGPLPSQLNSPFAHFSYLFPQHQQQQYALHQQQQQQRFKLKRQRQRVDAGEPRNSYQGAKTGMASEGMTVLFPWMNQNEMDYIKEDQPTDLTLKEEHHDVPVTDTSDDTDIQLDVENADERELEDRKEESPSNESPVSHESTSSSSSKRKQCAPQRNIADTLGFEIAAQENPEEINVNPCRDQTVSPATEQRESEETEETETVNPLEKLSALQSQLNTPSINDMVEAQRRLCSNFFEQQKKFMQSPLEPQVQEKPRAPRDFAQLAQALKSEISENLSTMIDKIVKDWAADMARMATESARPAMPIFPHFPPHNPMAFGMNPGAASGIFPSPFNGFNPLAALNSLRRPYPMDDEACKKKRAKVTDSVRKMNGTPLGRESPSSGRSSPQMSMSHSTPMSYFPPTMVGHPLYGGAAFGDREDSPTNSDDNSDCGPYDASQSATLTPMHLRKAKLMFFYTRYPNSALLKSYFPDIRFNKNNTAQLVKWFSNFREFYYIQMEKYARQALSEGVRTREEIHVTMESEIFKTLNQHYNRNNHIQPPERLVSVVEESLREFYDAIHAGKDSEPSWKKTIYKVINRMDDHIPEYFKEPNFLERLE